MVKHVAQKVLGTLKIETKDAEGKIVKSIDLTPNWKRAKYKDLVREKAGADWFEISPAERRQRAHDLGAEITKDYADFEVTGAVFEKLIEPTLMNRFCDAFAERTCAAGKTFSLRSNLR